MKRLKSIFCLAFLILCGTILFTGCNDSPSDTTPTSYIVTFNSCGGSNIDSIEIESGNFIIPPINPIRDNYEFLGWYLDINYNTEFDFNNTAITSDITLFAKWEKINYKITYVLNNGVNGSNPVSYTKNDTIVLENASKEGYTFAGWYTDQMFKNKISVIEGRMREDLILYAKFIINTHTISFDTNGGNFIEPITLNYGDRIYLDTPIKEGYTFGYWYTEDLNRFNLTIMPDNDLTLYAKWKVAVDVYIDNELTQIIYTDEANNFAITPPQPPEDITTNPNSERYFYGWFTDSNFQTPLLETTKFTVNSNIYGKWITVYSNSFIYSVSNGMATITDFLNTTATIVVVPAYINSFPVKSISDYAFADKTMIRNVIICNGIEEISNYAFHNCNSMEKISIPLSVDYISCTAFNGCSLLPLNIKGNVKYIGGTQSEYEYALNIVNRSVDSITIDKNCRNIDIAMLNTAVRLVSIYVEEDNLKYSSFDGVLYNKEQTEILHIPCYLAGEITIPYGIENIDNNEFENITRVTKFNLPNSLKTIGEYAFSNCSALTEITIPNSVVSIGKFAFYLCNSLEKISLPFIGTSRETTDIIESDSPSQYLFGYIFGYATVTTNSNSFQNPVTPSGSGILTWSGQGYYSYYNWDSPTFGKMYTFRYWAYYIPKSLREVIITDSVNISPRVFYNCDFITSITITEGTENLGTRAFYGCEGLETVIIESANIYNTITTSSYDYLLAYVTTIKVLKSIVDNEENSNVSLNSKYYDKTEDGDYYVYTKKQ